jgi:hypothetical protein
MLARNMTKLSVDKVQKNSVGECRNPETDRSLMKRRHPEEGDINGGNS